MWTAKAVDVLGDMVANPGFPAAEIEPERKVVLEEIKMLHDDPSRRIGLIAKAAFWPGHPLGLPIIGNCFNIIAGNFYMTKEGVLYKLNHVEGLTYEIDPGFPEIVKEASWGTDSRGKNVAVPGEARVKVRVSWTYGDNKGEHDLSYQIKVQNRMTPDAICGKAICRAAKWLHAKILGLEAPVTEDGAQVIDVTPAKKPPVEPVKPSKSSDRLRAACKVEDAQVVPDAPPKPGDTSSLRSDADDGSTLL
jgi:hypothetical protein